MPKKNAEVAEIVEKEATPDTKAAIDSLILKLVEDVKAGRSRDEFKTLAAIEGLYNAVK